MSGFRGENAAVRIRGAGRSGARVVGVRAPDRAVRRPPPTDPRPPPPSPTAAVPPFGVLGRATRAARGNADKVTSSSANPAARPSGRPGPAPRGPSARPARAALWALAAVAGVAVSTVTTAAWRSNNRHGLPLTPAGLHLYCAAARPPHANESVSVLLPMHHQEHAAIATVSAALGQTGVARVDVVLLDDGCPHSTRSAVAREFGDDPRLRVLAAAPLPTGWSPVAHRSHQLAVAAKGSVLLFADPAVPLGPSAAASATALLRAEHLDLVVLDSGRRVERGRTAQPPGTGRFAVAVDCAVYWKFGGYRTAAADPSPLSLLRVIRKVTGRAGLADGRRVLLPTRYPMTAADPTDATGAQVRIDADGLGETTQATAPPPAETHGGAITGGPGTGEPSRPSLSDTARRVLGALSGSR
jgi:hypothetical protein